MSTARELELPLYKIFYPSFVGKSQFVPDKLLSRRTLAERALGGRCTQLRDGKPLDLGSLLLVPPLGEGRICQN